MDNTEQVIGNIKRLMKKQGLSAGDLSTETGIPYSTLFRIFKGDSCPRNSTLKKIADLFSVNLEDLKSDNLPLTNQITHIPVVPWQQINSWLTKSDSVNYDETVPVEKNLGEHAFAAIISDTIPPLFRTGSILIICKK